MQLTIKKYHCILFLTALLIISSSKNFSTSHFNPPSPSSPTSTVGKPPSPLEGEGEVARGEGEVELSSRKLETSASLKAPLPAITSELKKIALTFDDGPHPGYTERLLAMLDDADTPATFFVVGKQVEKYPELLQRIFQHGHELANHSYSHPDLRLLSEGELLFELEKTHKLVQAITDQGMRYFRPPGGKYNESVAGLAKEWGYEMVLWTVFPQDHSNPPASLIKKRILKNVGENGIVLLHSGVENTLKILPEIIAELRKRGYCFVTLSELSPASRMAGRRINPELAHSGN